MGIEHQIENIRRELNELEHSVALQDKGDNFPYESVRKRNVFAKQQGMIMSNPEDGMFLGNTTQERQISEFGIHVNTSFMESTGSMFNMTAIEVGEGIFGVEVPEGHEVSVGVAEIHMELASMESSSHEVATDVVGDSESNGEFEGAEAGSGDGGETGE